MFLYMHGIYPMKYALFWWSYQQSLMNLHDVFAHILQDCFTATGAIISLGQSYDCPSDMIAPVAVKQQWRIWAKSGLPNHNKPQQNVNPMCIIVEMYSLTTYIYSLICMHVFICWWKDDLYQNNSFTSHIHQLFILYVIYISSANAISTYSSWCSSSNIYMFLCNSPTYCLCAQFLRCAQYVCKIHTYMYINIYIYTNMH